ncbi:MAG: DNA repair protein RecN [Candidatus Schekmanbacteria bacterium]|nr:MAG: DNA repair protein RecN [Candidatus Schekmanbacteria bacterium]
MLSELSIKNFAIIENLKVSFEKGLNVFTGETGAGKSIIVDALTFALGGRASTDLIRTGAEETEVEAVFELEAGHPLFSYLSEKGIDCETDSTLFFKRIYNRKGKNSVYINNQRCTLSVLNKAGDLLVDIHGQHSHQQILKESFQLEIIDSFGNLFKYRDEVKELFKSLSELKEKSKSLKAKIEEMRDKKELLQFQVDELTKADLKEGEEEELEKERTILKNSLSILEALSQSLKALYESETSAYTVLGECASIIRKQSKFDEKLQDYSSRLDLLVGEIDDICREIEKYSEKLSFDESRLNEIEERLFTIQELKRKYHCSIEELIKIREKKERELQSIDLDSKELEKIDKEIDFLEKKLHTKCNELSMKRKEKAIKLEKEIQRELSFLNMEKVKFKISFSTSPEFISQSGMDKVTFLISPNPGEDLKPLSNIASGGELSRFMLSLKAITSKFYEMPVVVFDEIDAGIGGQTAEKVGKKLKDISKDREVLCITHFPQIAKFASCHYLISKTIEGNRTLTNIKKLTKKERIEELARMFGSDSTSEVSKKHAEEMLKAGN